MTRSGISESYGSSIFSFLKNLHTVLHSGYANLHSHQQCKSVLFSQHLLRHLLFVDFLWWPFWLMWGNNLIVVFICISVVISDVEHLFMCFLAICILWRNIYLVFPPIELAWAVHVFWRLVPCRLFHLQIYFFPFYRLLVLFMVFFTLEKFFILIRSQLFLFLFSLL